ncbi:hypothetical protein DFH06DRAFT_1166930 [Mycena polygramma]|nr:hypothetical protein DFH06DRAFT_1166930 [Mycena polygramma]
MTSLGISSNAPKLPPELEREIFMIAAVIDEQAIPTLLRVARRVLVWIEPLLYKKFVFRRRPWEAREAPLMRRLSAAIHAIQAKPLAFVETNIRDIIWWQYIGQEHAETLLSICSGVRNLALIILTHPMVSHFSTLQHLQRLTVPLDPRFPLDLPALKASFASLTHLHVHSCVADLNLLWISTLPSLTHFCIENPASNDRPALYELLHKSPKLQVCVCTFDLPQMHVTPSGPWIEDQRVVIMQLDIDSDKYVRSWKLGADGGRDFWAQAEEFLARKSSDASITAQLCDWE